MTGLINHNQTGFSLTELLLGTTLLLVLVTLIGSFMLNLTKTVNQTNESEKVTEAADFAALVIKKDLAATAGDMTASGNAAKSGSFPLSFFPNQDYQIGTDNAVRISGNAASLLEPKFEFSGIADLSLTAGSILIRLENESGNFRQIERLWSPAAGEIITFTSSEAANQEIFADPLSGGTVRLRLKQNSVTSGNQIKCATTFYSGTRLIFQKIGACDNSYVKIKISLPGGSRFDNGTVFAGNLRNIQSGNELPVVLPLLPTYNNQRIRLPIFATAAGFVILRSRTGFKPVYLISPARLDQPGAIRDFVLNDTSQLAVGDCLLLGNPGENYSALIFINSISGSTIKALVEDAPLSAAPLIPGFSSLRADYQGHEFTTGTRLSLFSPPVEYLVRSGIAQTSALYRREIGKPWEMILPSIKNYSFASNISNSSASVRFKMDVMSEDVSTKFFQPVEFVVSPSALNRIFDAD